MKVGVSYMNDIYNDYTNKLNDISFQISNTDENINDCNRKIILLDKYGKICLFISLIGILSFIGMVSFNFSGFLSISSLALSGIFITCSTYLEHCSVKENHNLMLEEERKFVLKNKYNEINSILKQLSLDYERDFSLDQSEIKNYTNIDTKNNKKVKKLVKSLDDK